MWKGGRGLPKTLVLLTMLYIMCVYTFSVTEPDACIKVTIACSYEPTAGHSWGESELLLLIRSNGGFILYATNYTNYPPFSCTQLKFYITCNCLLRSRILQILGFNNQRKWNRSSHSFLANPPNLKWKSMVRVSVPLKTAISMHLTKQTLMAK